MKKLLFLFALCLAMFLSAYTVVPKGTLKNEPRPTTDFYENTEYLVITFAFHTPFGVPLLDNEGNPVLDEKNSPVIVLEERYCQFRKVLRITTAKKEAPQFAWGRANPQGDLHDGHGGLFWDPVEKTAEFMSFITADGDTKGYFNLDVECPFDRGLGMGKMILQVTGYMKMKPEKGRFVISSGWGRLVGRGVDDSGATGTGEKAVKIERPLTGFGAWGTVNFTRYDGVFTYGNLRNILKEKITIDASR